MIGAALQWTAAVLASFTGGIAVMTVDPWLAGMSGLLCLSLAAHDSLARGTKCGHSC